MRDLLCYIRHVRHDLEGEGIRTCHSLEGHTRGKGDYFHINVFFKTERLVWEDCAGAHLDDARAVKQQFWTWWKS